MTEGRRLSPLWELTRSRLLSFLREPGALFWVFIFPVLLAVALGIAFRSRPPESFPIAVIGEVPAAETATANLDASPGVEAALLPADEAKEALRTGKVDLVVELASAGPTPSFVYHYDEMRPQSRSARLAAQDALERALGRQDVAAASDRLVTERGARYIDFLLPGLIGLNLMGSGMWGVGFVLVMARSRKQLKRLAATPMRRSHYLLAMMGSRLALLALELVALVAFGWLVFGVKVHGSLLDLGIVGLTGAATFTGLALLVGARPLSIEAASGLMNLVMLPMWVLSGSFFSYERFPDALQAVIRILPLTAINDALRRIINDGDSILTTGPELLVLVAWGVLSFAVALKIFRWQ